jgi:transmembrane sensor
MTRAKQGIPQGIQDVARRWLLRNALDGRSDARDREFRQWSAADPLHRESYARAEQAWSALGRLEHTPELREMMQLPRRRRLGRAGLAIAATLLLGVGAWLYRGVGEPAPERFATGAGRIQEYSLADGSKLVLGAKTVVEVALAPRERRVRLISGEAYFKVARDARRPFIVAADGATVRVLGTAFDVRTGDGRVRVAVAQGAVEVEPAIEGESVAPPRRLEGGQGVVVAGDGRYEPGGGLSKDAGAWRNGQLRYDDVPLSEIVADANRYLDGEIRLGTAELGALRVTTAFRAGQIREMLHTLPSVLPVEVVESAPGRILLRKASPRG